MPDDNSDIVTRLTADMKAAMKSGDKGRLGVIRMLLADAKGADLQKPPVTPQQAVESYHKKAQKDREQYAKLGDADRTAALDAELAVVQDYVPKKADAAATVTMVDAFLGEHPEFGQGDVGKATGLFMKQSGGNADAKAANQRIREVLQSR